MDGGVGEREGGAMIRRRAGVSRYKTVAIAKRLCTCGLCGEQPCSTSARGFACFPQALDHVYHPNLPGIRPEFTTVCYEPANASVSMDSIYMVELLIHLVAT